MKVTLSVTLNLFQGLIGLMDQMLKQVQHDTILYPPVRFLPLCY
jgi:hypothetical protein